MFYLFSYVLEDVVGTGKEDAEGPRASACPQVGYWKVLEFWRFFDRVCTCI